jgi:hypothetical protein
MTVIMEVIVWLATVFAVLVTWDRFVSMVRFFENQMKWSNFIVISFDSLKSGSIHYHRNELGLLF